MDAPRRDRGAVAGRVGGADELAPAVREEPSDDELDALADALLGVLLSAWRRRAAEPTQLIPDRPPPQLLPVRRPADRKAA